MHGVTACEVAQAEVGEVRGLVRVRKRAKFHALRARFHREVLRLEGGAFRGEEGWGPLSVCGSGAVVVGQGTGAGAARGSAVTRWFGDRCPRGCGVGALGAWVVSRGVGGTRVCAMCLLKGGEGALGPVQGHCRCAEVLLQPGALFSTGRRQDTQHNEHRSEQGKRMQAL